MTLPTSADTERDWLVGNTFSGGRSVNQFEIITDQDAVVLQGSRDEADDRTLSGKVVLDLKEPVTGVIRLRFSRKIRHRARIAASGDPFTSSPGLVELVDSTSDRHNSILGGENRKLAAGRHEYPFSITIPADTPASLEGPSFTYVIYRLKCAVERGRFQKDLVAKKHVRIHRIFRSDTLALQHPAITEASWEGKCAYYVETPAMGIIYGTKIPMKYRIAPLKKGVVPVRGRVQLEQVIMTRQQDNVGVWDGREHSKVVLEDTVRCDENMQMGEDGWYEWDQSVELPRDLTKICQSYREPALPVLRVKYMLNYYVGLRNPEGHISEIRGKFEVRLFFTRQMHIDDRYATGQPEPTDDLQELLDVPPDYSHSQLDQLYSEIDITAFATPLNQSGANTPQRNISSNSLQALLEDREHEEEEEELERQQQQRRRGSADDTEDHAHEAHANTLRNRLDEIVNPVSAQPNRVLAGLRSREPRNRQHGVGQSPLSGPVRTPAQEMEDPMDRAIAMQRSSSANTVDHHSSEACSTQLTRQNSPIHIEEMSRVPSYDTALRTPAPRGLPGAQFAGDDVTLPTYEDASRQNSVDSTSNWPTTNGCSHGHGHGTATPPIKRSGVLSSLLNRVR